MKIGIYQFDPSWGKKEVNLNKIKGKLSRHPDVDIWVLPELATTGYQIPSQEAINELAEPFPTGDTGKQLRNLSNELEAGIIIGVAEKEGGNIYNSSVVFENGRYIGNYRKVHLYYEEKKYFKPGKMSPPVLNIKDVKVGLMICFDWIFPETARTLAIKGAQLLAHPANLVLPYCQDAMLTRSIENKVFTATANRIGQENKTGEQMTFTGKSQITDLKGKRLDSLSENEEGMMKVEINPKKAEDKSINKYNNLLKDRRSSLYEL